MFLWCCRLFSFKNGPHDKTADLDEVAAPSLAVSSPPLRTYLGDRPAVLGDPEQRLFVGVAILAVQGGRDRDLQPRRDALFRGLSRERKKRRPYEESNEG